MKISSIFVIAILIVSPVAFSGQVFADFNATTREYFCNSSDLKSEKSGYSYFAYQENKYWMGTSPQDIAATLLKSSYPSTMLDNLGRSYHCLKENNIDPDSIAKILPEILQGLNLAKEQDPVRFSQIAQSFDSYVPVPEFGPLAGLVVILSIISILFVSRRKKI